MKLSTGVGRLDELLGGGLAPRAFALLHGPPFLGKDVLADRFLMSGLQSGQGGILVCTNETWQDARQRLAARHAGYAEAERRGLVRIVDAYSYQIGGGAPTPAFVEVVGGLQNLSDVAYAANEAHRALAPEGQPHRLVVNSLSTLTVQTNAQTTFRFLQTFLAHAKRAGAAGVTLLEMGMHAAHEVEGFKSLHAGAVEMAREGERKLMRVDGLDVHASPGWMEYRHNDRQLEIVGPFAGGRIR